MRGIRDLDIAGLGFFIGDGVCPDVRVAAVDVPAVIQDDRVVTAAGRGLVINVHIGDRTVGIPGDLFVGVSNVPHDPGTLR